MPLAPGATIVTFASMTTTGAAHGGPTPPTVKVRKDGGTMALASGAASVLDASLGLWSLSLTPQEAAAGRLEVFHGGSGLLTGALTFLFEGDYTTARAGKLDNVPGAAAGAVGGLALVGSAMALTGAERVAVSNSVTNAVMNYEVNDGSRDVAIAELLTDTQFYAKQGKDYANQALASATAAQTAALAAAKPSDILTNTAGKIATDSNGFVTTGSVAANAIGPASISATGFTAIANAVWGAGARTLTAFAFSVSTIVNGTETAIKAVTDKVAGMLENVGGVDRFKASALATAPTGSGSSGGGGGSTGSSPASIVGSPVWQVQMLSRDRIAVLGMEDLVLVLTGQAGPYRMLDNTGYAVTVALVPFGQEPDGSTTWYPATRHPDGTVRATFGTGAGQIALAAGKRYGVFATIAGVILRAGTVLGR